MGQIRRVNMTRCKMAFDDKKRESRGSEAHLKIKAGNFIYFEESKFVEKCFQMGNRFFLEKGDV